ncbi:AbrB/MazE/SpoVT family DNA-binding domain-containing protein [Candidatus Acetothermia bacterium]|nr:AbrB/MazE/SpoVT family DNA-binding domain-containing protein [Candidatus Acetothermia bacterium]
MSTLTTTKVSSKGQIVVPRDLREKLGLQSGDTLVLARHGDILVLKKLTLDTLLDESERNFLEGHTLSHPTFGEGCASTQRPTGARQAAQRL